MKVFTNHSSGRFFQTVKIHKFVSIIFLCAVLFIQARCMDYPAQLEHFALYYFADVPGISLACNSKNEGHLFELEAAICLPRVLMREHVGVENIIGFSLGFDFLGTHAVLPVDGEGITPETFEYDIITNNFIIECKTSIEDGSAKIEQFIKEQKMIHFIEWLLTMIEMRGITLQSEIGKRNRRIFKFVYAKQEIKFTCSWIGNECEALAIKNVVRYMSVLRGKQLKIFVKNSMNLDVAAQTIQIIRMMGIDLYDSVTFNQVFDLGLTTDQELLQRLTGLISGCS